MARTSLGRFWAPRSSPLPCACSSTYLLPLPFAQIILSFVPKQGSRHQAARSPLTEGILCSHLPDSWRYELQPFFRITDCKASLSQTQIRHQLPQLRVFVTQLLHLLRLAHVHATVLRLPGVDRVLRFHFPRHVFHRPTPRCCFSTLIMSASV